MASKALKRPLILTVSRNYSAAVQPVFKTLPSKIAAAAVESSLPITRITVAFRAGARYEPSSDLGLTHVLRSSAGLTTGKSSGFLIQRRLSQIGGVLSASTDREFLYYTLETHPGNLDTALACLTDVISSQEFRPWELSDNNNRLKYDLLTIPPAVRAVDLLHKAAYRTGLGNSLFVNPARIGKISSESLQYFYTNHLTPERAAVVVVGNSFGNADIVSNCLSLPKGTQPQASSNKYYGGELREDVGGDLAHIAVAVEGAAAGADEAVTLAVAAKVLGAGPQVKWGNNKSLLADAVGNVGPCAAAGFSVSYSDSGLFGFVLSVPKEEAYAATKSAVGAMRKPGVSTEAIKAAKNQLMLQVQTEAENGTQFAESMAAQLLTTGNITSPDDICKAISNVNETQVKSVLMSIGTGKISMGSYGNVTFVPYIDELLA